MLTAFIDDGYTEDTVLPEISGISPAIRFTFRPMTSSESSDYAQVSDKLTLTEGKKEAAKRLAAKITGWDLRDSKGTTVEVKPENLLKLKPIVFSGLWEIVTGQAAGSKPPEDDAKN